MEHQEAIQLKAVERYLLGELSGDLRDQFEDHFFGCPECALDVEAGAIFVDSAKEVLGAPDAVAHVSRPATPMRPGWFGYLLRPAFAGPALAVLLLFTAYQSGVVIPHLKTELSQVNAPQVLAWYSLIAQNSRGGAPLTISVPSNQPIGIFLDIPPEKRFPAYTCTLESEAGSPEFSVPVPAQQAAESLQLLIPSSQLRPGKHVLVIRGMGSSQGIGRDLEEVARYPFSVEFTK